LWSDCLKEEILYDPAENYARKVVRRLEQMTLPEREEEIILRSYIFKTAVLDLYEHRCSVSGLKIEMPGPVLPRNEQFHPSKERLRKHLMRFE